MAKNANGKTKYHDEFEQAAGVILLAQSGYNYAATAKQLDVTEQTLRNWERNSLTKKEAIPIMLENATRKLLEMIPDEWTGNSWAIALGILMDKWLLVNGQPTQRTESIFGEIDDLPQEEKDSIVREAERIIREAINRKGNSSGSNSSEDEK